MESLSVRIKEQASTGEIIVGIYYRPPDQEEPPDEDVYTQLKVASRS